MFLVRKDEMDRNQSKSFPQQDKIDGEGACLRQAQTARQAHLRQLQEQMVKQKTNCIDSKSQEVIAELANESDAESNAEDHKKSDESPLEDENEDESEDAGMSFGIDLPKKIGKSKRLEIERDKKHHRAKRY